LKFRPVLQSKNRLIGHYYQNSIKKKPWHLFLPRMEILILLAGLLFTAWGKWTLLEHKNTPHIFNVLLCMTLSDVIFFSSVLLLIAIAYAIKPCLLTARFALLISIFVTGWAVLNVGWLLKSGVQLQPSVLRIMVRDYKETWPFIQPFIVKNTVQTIILIVLTLIAFAFFIFCFVRPRKVSPLRKRHIRWATINSLIIILLLLIRPLLHIKPDLSFDYGLFGFSSHWYALVSVLPTKRNNRNVDDTGTRQMAYAGQRQILEPQGALEELPNVIIVLLESVSYTATSLHNPNLDTTPTLVRLANEGVNFELTRVPVSHTTKAFWATLTSSYPVIAHGYAEAIPSSGTYEGLPSILGKVGYRSAFFEVSRGSFECAPAFFNNLGFDWAWFRENLEDPTAYIGSVAGDDCRMLEPAFKWASESSHPFLLMMITSVAHEPYDVPEWFGSNDKGPSEKYLQSIRFTDYFIEQLCQTMKKYGYDQNSILCILGDHGTSLHSQNNKARWYPNEEIIRVPWIMRWPGHIEAGKIIDWPCSQMDVAATILNLIGFDISKAGFDGRDSLTPQESDRKLYFSSWYADSPLGYIEGNKKVVYWPYIDKVFEYDLVADPSEEKPQEIVSQEKQNIKADILNWQRNSRIAIDPKKYRELFLYSHWQVFSIGDFAGAYYVP